jgi:hypothetical protein
MFDSLAQATKLHATTWTVDCNTGLCGNGDKPNSREMPAKVCDSENSKVTLSLSLSLFLSFSLSLSPPSLSRALAL